MATGRGKSSGFTLVELMVVLAIIGVSATAVVLMLPGEDAAARKDAERFASRLIAARDHALFSGRQTSAYVDARGYRFEESVGGEWMLLNDPPLKVDIWDAGVTATSDAPFPVRIRFDSVGVADGSDLTLSSGGEIVMVTLDSGGQPRLR
ncbi:MAG: GspH/FimT family pseudopilin [Pacificimonas sp.]